MGFISKFLQLLYMFVTKNIFVIKAIYAHGKKKSSICSW